MEHILIFFAKVMTLFGGAINSVEAQNYGGVSNYEEGYHSETNSDPNLGINVVNVKAYCCAKPIPTSMGKRNLMRI